MSYEFLQQYWWFLVSLLGALLVFLMFVQGANSLVGSLGRTPEGRNCIEIDGLEITSQYIKIAPAKAFDAAHAFSFVVKGQSYGEIFNAKGERLESTWGCRIPGQGAPFRSGRLSCRVCRPPRPRAGRGIRCRRR